MLCKDALKRLNEWFGLYIADEKTLRENLAYIDSHPSEDAYKFMFEHEDIIDEVVRSLAEKSKDSSFSRECAQSLLTDSDIAFGINLRYMIFSEYLEENPNKEIIISDLEPQFILDCFINYPKELMHPHSLL